MGSHAHMADDAYLIARKGTGRSGARWYCKVRIPSDLRGRPAFAKNEFIVRALGTDSKTEARRRKLEVLQDIFALFDRERARIRGEIEAGAKLWVDGPEIERLKVRTFFLEEADGDINRLPCATAP
ncbi:MAG: DUF6538 domain-containing protein [Alphaproteobacteria bacterium]